MVYEGYRIYGPYLGKDKRLRAVLYKSNKNRLTISYPKLILEKSIGRYLEKDETVDHIDRDPLNNNLSNLRVLTRSEHAKIDVRRLEEQEFSCPTCGENFLLSGSRLSNTRHNAKQGKSGPFCSSKCVGIYGRKVQMGLIDKLTSQEIIYEYTSLKKQSLHGETHGVDNPNSGKPSFLEDGNPELAEE